MAKFLIQNAIWTVKNFGIDTRRIDTYMYNDQPFMNRCNAALLAEYPRIHIFGESSVTNVVDQAYYVKNNIRFPFKSNQPGGLDFVPEGAILDGLKQDGRPSACTRPWPRTTYQAPPSWSPFSTTTTITASFPKWATTWASTS